MNYSMLNDDKSHDNYSRLNLNKKIEPPKLGNKIQDLPTYTYQIKSYALSYEEKTRLITSGASARQNFLNIGKA